MKHILHIIESLEFGGAEKVLLDLANAMVGQYKITVCLTKRAGELVKEADPRVNIVCLQSAEGNDLSVVSKLTDLITREHVDIVHIHNWGVYLEATLAVKRSKVARCIQTIHGPYIFYAQRLIPQLKKRVRNFLEHRMSRYIDAHVCVSNDIQKDLMSTRAFSKTKVLTIHNGIAGLPCSPQQKRAPENLSKTINFVAVGRLAKIKNHSLLLKGFAELKNIDSIHLTLVGDGPERANLEQLAGQLGISERVTFLGFSDRVADILNRMDVFVVTSEYEGISIAILEAMSLKLPVIATNVGGIPETVKHNETGLLINQTADSLANAMRYLVSNPSSIQKMGDAGFAVFQNDFHQSIVIDKYKQLYEAKSL